MSAPTLLRIDSSIYSSTSASRDIAGIFENAWTDGGGSVAHRDLGLSPLPYLREIEHSAMFVPEDARNVAQRHAQAEAARLADELYDADTLLVGAPLYNLGMSAGLKTWFDRLFTDPRLFPGFGVQQPFAGRTAVVILSRGGAYGIGSAREGWDHQEPYVTRLLRDLLGYRVEVIECELTHASQNPAMAGMLQLSVESRARAEESAAQLAADLVSATPSLA